MAHDDALERIAGELRQIRGALENLLHLLGLAVATNATQPDSVFQADDEMDELYLEAKKLVLRAGKASSSFLQRKLGIGYARAASLIDKLEERGIIGPANGSTPRRVLKRRLDPEVIATLENIEKQLNKKKKKS